MLDSYWFTYKMQSTVFLLGCLHCHIKHSNRDPWYTDYGTCAYLHFITTTIGISTSCI